MYLFLSLAFFFLPLAVISVYSYVLLPLFLCSFCFISTLSVFSSVSLFLFMYPFCLSFCISFSLYMISTVFLSFCLSCASLHLLFFLCSSIFHSSLIFPSLLIFLFPPVTDIFFFLFHVTLFSISPFCAPFA